MKANGKIFLPALALGGVAIALGANVRTHTSAGNQGKLAPMNYQDKIKTFGAFAFVPAPTPGNPEGIRVTDNWNAENLVQVGLPQLRGVVGAPESCRVWWHKLVAGQLVDLFGAWQDAGLVDRILSWEGSLAQRFVRGSSSVLSSHSWGTAFDINYRWNQLGHVPAQAGTKGSVRELVALANAHGFAWGGDFPGRPDGGHFEIARLTRVPMSAL